MGIPIFSSLGSDAVLSVKLSTGTARRLFFTVADLGQFKAILNHFVVILGSFFGHFLDHFLVTFWITFGCHFGADGPGVIFTAGLGVIFTAGLGVIFTAGLGVISTAGLGVIFTAGLGVIFTAGLGVIFTAGRVVTFTAGLGIVQVVWFHARVHQTAPDASKSPGTVFVTGSRAQMGPSGMVWESSATGLGRTGQPKSQANRKALQGPYKAL